MDLSHGGIVDSIPDWFQNVFSSSTALGLDVSYNQLTGKWFSIPSNLQEVDVSHIGHEFFIRDGDTDLTYEDKVLEHIKDIEREYSASYFISIDLSSNNITGAIPKELMDLLGLIKFNVSGNQINGSIPDQIGNLRQLKALDLSRNKLTGPIPLSLSNLSFLTRLNLSSNDLSGRIPTGQQLQTMTDSSIYMGNDQLCGAPALKKCHDELEPSDNSRKDQHVDYEDDDADNVWFYSGFGPGLLVGLLGFCGPLYFSETWRNAYFRSVDNLYDKLLVLAVALKAAWPYKTRRPWD